MTNPIDLTNFHEMTGSDLELEHALFQEFFSSGAECISVLQTACNNSDNAVWRSTAHAFKGTALNLGANHLGALCKKAQETPESPQAEKIALLAEITDAFEAAKKYIVAL